VRRRVGAVANLKRVLIVQRLPKTRSGKILRNVMRALADGEPAKVPPTIEDPAVLTEIEQLFKQKDIHNKH
jgi:propionyl-CoA synthetase